MDMFYIDRLYTFHFFNYSLIRGYLPCTYLYDSVIGVTRLHMSLFRAWATVGHGRRRWAGRGPRGH